MVPADERNIPILAAIGLVTVTGAGMELALVDLHEVMSRSDAVRGEMFRDAYRGCVREIRRISATDPAFPTQRAAAAVEEAQRLWLERNEVIHGWWWDSDNGRHLVHHHRRGGAVFHHRWTPDDLNDFADQLGAVSDELITIADEMSPPVTPSVISQLRP